MCHSIPVMSNSKPPRCYMKTTIMAEQLILGVWPTISHLLSLKQHITILFMHIPHIGTKRKPLTKAGSPNIPVHMVATYGAFRAVLDFLCHYVLRRLPDVHARVHTSPSPPPPPPPPSSLLLFLSLFSLLSISSYQCHHVWCGIWRRATLSS